jgi:uncharacterized protein YdiU (UPF0061 family)
MEEALKAYRHIHADYYLYLMRSKLGITDMHTEQDLALIKHLLGMLQSLQIEYTLFFRTLSHYSGDRTMLLKLGLYHQPMHDWLDAYDQRLTLEEISTEQRQLHMLQTNPKYILKNYMLQEAIEAAEIGDFSLVEDLFTIAQQPYDTHPAFEKWAGATPRAYKNQKLSCSS